MIAKVIILSLRGHLMLILQHLKMNDLNFIVYLPKSRINSISCLFQTFSLQVTRWKSWAIVVSVTTAFSHDQHEVLFPVDHRRFLRDIHAGTSTALKVTHTSLALFIILTVCQGNNFIWFCLNGEKNSKNAHTSFVRNMTHAVQSFCTYSVQTGINK